MKLEKEFYDNEINKAIEIFRKVFPSKNIVSIEKIHLGLTNISFKVLDNNNNLFQVRIGMNNEYVNRHNEKNILKNIKDKNYIYFDENSGNAIKKWISGDMLEDNQVDLSFLIKLNKKINKYHKKKIKYPIITHNYFEFENTFQYINKKFIDEYIDIINSHKNDKLVLSHNDLNPKNLIVNNKKLYFIDFEWGRINYEWYDICNFIREVDIDIEIVKKFAKSIKKNFILLVKDIFACLCFALQWTYSVEQVNEIIEYRKIVHERMEYYYNIFNTKN